jgi:hypothetical protein
MCRGNFCFIFVKIGNFTTSSREKLVHRVRITGVVERRASVEAEASEVIAAVESNG